MNGSMLGDITQIITALTAFGAMLLAWRASFKINKVADKVDDVHRATNGLVDKLVDTTATAARAEGLAVGLADKANNVLKK
jgi:hypothetical protein